MENKQLKNMIVLRNLPSNIIEEAIVVLKQNKKIQLPEMIEKNKEISHCEEEKNDYILKEAEFVVSNYISNIEKEKKMKNHKNIETKYKQTRVFSIVMLVLFVLQFIIR